ncbi:MAG: hypothetical protein IK104_10070 [Clostridia bacterium]|nr:hypothetical protein [Clostridia bacterium]
MKTYDEIYEAALAARDEARSRAEKRKKTLTRAIPAAAALVVAAAVALTFLTRDKPVPPAVPSVPDAAESTAHTDPADPAESKAQSAADRLTFLADGTVLRTDVLGDNAPAVPVPNSSLALVPFDESMLRGADLIVEGTVEEAERFEMLFTTQDDGKFGADTMTIHYTVHSVVYSLRVARVYAGDPALAGTLVRFEDESGFFSSSGYRVGGTYVIPLTNVGTGMYWNASLALSSSRGRTPGEGEPGNADLDRRLPLATLWPYIPAVEKTASGYVVPSDWWATAELALAELSPADPDDPNEPRLFLVEDGVFEAQMAAILDGTWLDPYTLSVPDGVYRASDGSTLTLAFETKTGGTAVLTLADGGVLDCVAQWNRQYLYVSPYGADAEYGFLAEDAHTLRLVPEECFDENDEAPEIPAAFVFVGEE